MQVAIEVEDRAQRSAITSKAMVLHLTTSVLHLVFNSCQQPDSYRQHEYIYDYILYVDLPFKNFHVRDALSSFFVIMYG